MSMFQQLLKESIGMENADVQGNLDVSLESLLSELRVATEDLAKLNDVYNHVNNLHVMMTKNKNIGLESAVFIESSCQMVESYAGTIKDLRTRKELTASLESAKEVVSVEGVLNVLRKISNTVIDKIKRIQLRLERLTNILPTSVRPIYKGLAKLSKEEYSEALAKLSEKDFDQIRQWIGRDGRPDNIEKVWKWMTHTVMIAGESALRSSLFTSKTYADWLAKVTKASSAILEVGVYEVSISVQGNKVSLHKEKLREAKEGKFDITQRDAYQVLDVGLINTAYKKIGAIFGNKMAEWANNVAEKTEKGEDEYGRYAIAMSKSLAQTTFDLINLMNQLLEDWKTFGKRVLAAAGKEVPGSEE